MCAWYCAISDVYLSISISICLVLSSCIVMMKWSWLIRLLVFSGLEIDGNVSVDAAFSTSSSGAESWRLGDWITSSSSTSRRTHDRPLVLSSPDGPCRLLLLPVCSGALCRFQHVPWSSAVLPTTPVSLSDSLHPRLPRHAQLRLPCQYDSLMISHIK